MTGRFRWLAMAGFTLSLVVSLGCRQEPTRWDEAQKAAEQRTEARAEAAAAGVLPKAVEGGQLNRYFPPEGAQGLTRVFEQEKEGFVQAKYSAAGTEATLSISDLVQNEDARKKFTTATERLGDHPLTTVGQNQSVILVADRWQVKVSSQQLDHASRKALLEQFDLVGLRSFTPPTH